MRPHPLVPSPRRSLVTLAALLISAALSLGFAPLSTSLLLGDETADSTLAGEPCELDKASAAGAVVSTASPAGTTADPVVPQVSPAVSAPGPAKKVSTTSATGKIPTASPVGLLESCPGVRPGAIVQTDTADGCTFNFVFTDGVHHYIGTAGHCVFPGPSVAAGGAAPPLEQTWVAGTGPVARNAEGNRIGEFAYGLKQAPFDFALIRMDRGVPFSPQMCHFGGPTGINDDLVGGPVPLHYYGNGIAIGTLAPARTAVAPNLRDPDVVSAVGVAVFGDSGAGVTSSDGRAVGVLVGSEFLPAQRVISIPRIAPQIARAEQGLGLTSGSLRLVTAPLQ